jgi:hypothetical protein
MQTNMFKCLLNAPLANFTIAFSLIGNVLSVPPLAMLLNSILPAVSKVVRAGLIVELLLSTTKLSSLHRLDAFCP